MIPLRLDITGDGAVTFSESANAMNYGVVDEIASRVIRSGGRILGVHKADIPGGKSLAAILRYANQVNSPSEPAVPLGPRRLGHARVG